MPVYDSSAVFDSALTGALVFGTGVLVGSAWNNRWGWNNRSWNQVWIEPTGKAGRSSAWRLAAGSSRCSTRPPGSATRPPGGGRPDRPGARPDRPAARPERPGVGPDRPGGRPDRPGARPDRPEIDRIVPVLGRSAPEVDPIVPVHGLIAPQIDRIVLALGRTARSTRSSRHSSGPPRRRPDRPVARPDRPAARPDSRPTRPQAGGRPGSVTSKQRQRPQGARPQQRPRPSGCELVLINGRDPTAAPALAAKRASSTTSRKLAAARSH